MGLLIKSVLLLEKVFLLDFLVARIKKILNHPMGILIRIHPERKMRAWILNFLEVF